MATKGITEWSNRPDLPLYSKITTFPPYRFVPGRAPHPVRDPAGHSFGVRQQGPVEPMNPADWGRNEDYLHGVDLFNRGYFWEAHEAWEPLWVALPPESPPAEFLQGLINLSASLLKIRMGECASAVKLWNSAARLLKPFEDTVCAGIDISRLMTDFDGFIRTMNDRPADSPVIILKH